MGTAAPDTDYLLRQAAAGDDSARGRLLDRHRDRLKRMVAVRADPRLAARVDSSDVVQEALTDAAHKLDRYLTARPLPFYPWLRKLALERLAQLHRRHVQAGRRSVTREEARMDLSSRSAVELAERLFARQSGPHMRLQRAELQSRVRSALAALKDADRELLILRHLEGLPAKEIAAILGVSEGAVNTRHVRALQRLRELLGDASD
ncbi:MAG TPA: sigma-70 family RNA polymerase sigma factor [Gemmataceae bacterium]|nr:sigma-70 family RNA polymerase sigma factor [Gemmataceae bacterium]